MKNDKKKEVKSDGNVLTKISKCNYFPVDSFLLFLAVVLSIGIVTPGGVVSGCVVTVTCGGVRMIFGGQVETLA